MKKIAVILMTTVLAAALIGCGPSGSSDGTSSLPDFDAFSDSGTSSSDSGSSIDDSSQTPDSSADNASSPQDSNNVYPNQGIAEGNLKDIMNTRLFTFSINSAYVCGEYASYIPEDGCKLLVVNLAIKSTTSGNLTLADTDFLLQWSNGEEDDYAFPMEDAHLVLDEKILPSEYALAQNAETSGLLIYEVPADIRDFYISYLEFFGDGSTGDTFNVHFTPEE
ncbi:MAG: DUF4352 domain-containing protein [Acetatifactor sp.]|nr:DUF4352 domain-containing protein [Acetatifactor sp.]